MTEVRRVGACTLHSLLPLTSASHLSLVKIGVRSCLRTGYVTEARVVQVGQKVSDPSPERAAHFLPCRCSLRSRRTPRPAPSSLTMTRSLREQRVSPWSSACQPTRCWGVSPGPRSPSLTQRMSPPCSSTGRRTTSARAPVFSPLLLKEKVG